MRGWPDVAPSIPGLVCRRIARADVPAVCAAVRAWYPDITVGAESGFLEPAFYDAEVAFLGEDEDRPIYALVVLAGDEIVTLAAIAYDERSRVIHGRLVAIHPRHQATGLGVKIGVAFEELGRRIGAELILNYVTLRHAYSQRLLERLGYRLVGVVPGHDRDQIAPGTVKRVWEALYARILGDAGAIEEPELANLTPTVARLLHTIRN